MKRIIKKISTIAPVLMGLSSLTQAQQADKINVITTAVPFLRISPDARAGGMGETGIVSTPDNNSQFYNVAKYPFTTQESGIGFTYTPWLKKLGLNDVYLASAAGYYKLDEMQAVSASLRYFSLGNIQLTDQNGSDLHSQRPREMAIDLGYSRKLSDRLALGMALRYINSNLVGNSTMNGTTYKVGSGFAGDIGLYYTTAKENTTGWNFGAVLSNLGTKIGYTSDVTQKSFLPANFGVGAGYTIVTNDVHKISLNGELNKLLVPAPPANATAEEYEEYNKTAVVSSWLNSFDNKAMAYSAGGEYMYDNQFAVRAGYYSDSRTMGKRNYFTAGFGINYSVLGLNFSYLVPAGKGTDTNPLGNTIRFSLLINPKADK
jgi:hypothetical protein